MQLNTPDKYKDLQVYYGDLHNHCEMSYGHGSLVDAIHNARLQLDFASVTLHAVWPDLPLYDPKLEYLIKYHQEGFIAALNNWPSYLELIDAHNEEGQFITFPSYEWHSIQYGDHCVYFKDGSFRPISQAGTLPALRKEVADLKTPALIIPHHIGYKQGSRGINWSAFSPEFSPVAEIFSFHGLSESSEGPYPYLHSMGPRNQNSTAQHGWAMGHVFGVIGSTDHHNAFPGSYGFGRLGVWAENLTRDSIWQAIAKRRTYALTGDRIELAFSLNDGLIGDICPPADNRHIQVSITGGDAIDYVDILHNNQLIHRECVLPRKSIENIFKVYVEFGWGEEPGFTPWQVDLKIENGRLRGVEPRFRGFGPTDSPQDKDMAYTQWERVSQDQVQLITRTRQNPFIHTAATEGMSLEIEADANTLLIATINGKQYQQPIFELLEGAQTYYLGGFVSPAFCFHRAVPVSEYTHTFQFLHHSVANQQDWYYIRVRQKNNQWAWSSPIWVKPHL